MDMNFIRVASLSFSSLRENPLFHYNFSIKTFRFADINFLGLCFSISLI